METLLKPKAENKVGRVTFYVFEIAALVIGALLFILTIVNTAQGGGFGAFVSGLVGAVFNTLVIYGLGRVVDLLYVKADCKKQSERKDN